MFNGSQLFENDVWGEQEEEVYDHRLNPSRVVTCNSPDDCQYKWSHGIGNTISIGLHTRHLSGGINGLAFMDGRILQVWDLHLTVNGNAQPYDPALVTFTKPDDGDPNCRDQDVFDDGRPPGPDGVCDFITGKGIDYDIAAGISGALVVLPRDSKYFNADNYARFLRATHAGLGSGELIAVYYADGGTGAPIYPGILKNEVDVTRPYARGVLFWNPPLELVQRDMTPPEGAFSDVSALAPSHDLTSYWHGYNYGLQGWYEKFRHTGLQTGTVSIDVHDSYANDSDDDYFVKTITDGAGNTYYRDAVPGDECTGSDSTGDCPGLDPGLVCTRTCTADDRLEHVTVDLGARPAILKLSMELIGISNETSSIYTTWDVPNPSSWLFSTGVTDLCYQPTYEAVLSAYTGSAGGPYNEDADGDGLHDCIDPEPEAANHWFWVNRNLASDCTAVRFGRLLGYTYTYIRGNPPISDAPPVLVPGVLNPAMAEADILSDCTDPNSVDYGIYVRSSTRAF
jgi:hypothetical protein